MITKMDLLNVMPPSAQIVYQILRTHKTLSSKELLSETQYSIRTIRYAIRRLMNAQMIIQIPDMTDTRRCFYAVRS
ncbi:MAG: hypothetical protein ACXADY_18670 [Candidatus Hodarchaeales archaeon]